MIGAALRDVREARDWGQKVVAYLAGVSESLVKEWEHGRRRVTEKLLPLLVRKVDDGQLYIAAKRQATGGPTASPWLDGIDGHRIVCAMKTVEELEEAIAAVKNIMPILMQSPDKISEAARAMVQNAMLEIIECTTAGENTCARLARLYDISLAELWDRHEQELVEKGYLNKEKSGFAQPQIKLSYDSISSAK